MLREPDLRDQVLRLDREIGTRLRITAAESMQWAEALCDLLNEALETHCRTLEGVEQHMTRIGCADVDGGLREYLTDCQEKFSNLMRDSFGALQVQDVTMQAIERACEAIEKRVAVFESPETQDNPESAAKLGAVHSEYVEIDNLHRTCPAEAA